MSIVTRFKSALAGFIADDASVSGLWSSTGDAPKRGSADLLKAYNEMPWLRTAVGKVATATAQVRWRIFATGRETRSGRMRWFRSRPCQDGTPKQRRDQMEIHSKQAELREIEIHPLLNLLRNGNGYHTGTMIRRLLQQHMDLIGEHFWLKERNELGATFAAWPVPPPWVISTPTPNNLFYELRFKNWQGRVGADDMVWFVEPDVTNPYTRGAGVAFALSDDLNVDEYAAQHMANKLFNRARPDMIISADGLKKGDTEALERRWRAKLQGPTETARPFFVSRKLDVKVIDQSFRDLGLIEIREFERDTIRQVYTVPPEIFGITDSSNKATIVAADFIFARHVLVPRLEWQRECFQNMLSEMDDRLIIDYDTPVQEDLEHQLKVATVAPHTLKVDEWRELAGLEALPDGDGDIHMMPFNLVPVAKPADLLEPAGSSEPG